MKTIPTHVTFPWIRTRVPITFDPAESIGGEETAVQNISKWTDDLRIAIERACFADYLQKIEDIGAEPPTVPMRKPLPALAIFLNCGREMPNNRLEFALARPTRRSDALLLAAQPERWAS